jgi:RNase P subunit RPR2
LPTAQQFICKKCRTLSNVISFEETRDGGYFCRCTNCGAKNRIVMTGESPSRPGVLPVLGLLDDAQK